MTRFLLRRLLVFAAVILAANALTHMLVNARARTFSFNSQRAATATASVHTLQHDYENYLEGVREGDWGAIATGRPVQEIVLEALPKSLILLVTALIISATLGVTLGVLSINHNTKQVNPIALLASLGGFSLPSFYMGIVVLGVMIWVTIIRGQSWIFLPISGYGLDEHLILPVLVLAARPMAEIARFTAELLAEELPKDYVRTARAKGLPWRLVIIRHTYRNILATVIVTIGNAMRYMLSSLVVVEFLFQWPGLGRLLVLSIWDTSNPNSGFMFAADLAATTMALVAAIYMISSLIADLAAHSVDPRARRFQTA